LLKLRLPTLALRRRKSAEMRFTLVAALAPGLMGMRPELGRAGVHGKISNVAQLLSEATGAQESMTALRAASGIVETIMAETSNATEHMSDDDAALLRSVIDLVESSIYGSMDSAHTADEQALAAGVAAVEACNADITARQAPDGDLGKLHQQVSDAQTELDRLQGVVDDETQSNASAWSTFDKHMQTISNPPACPDFPGRTMPQLDVFFESSDYSTWFAHQQAAYTAAKALYTAADAALDAAIDAYNIQKAVRDVQYCDWSSELEAACASFDTCYTEKSDDFNKRLVPQVQGDMNQRIEAFKAGETLVHQIKFLLGDEKNQETPAIVSSRYELDFPTLPPKGECDLGVLASSQWVPVVNCGGTPEWRLVVRQTFPTLFKNEEWSKNSKNPSANNFAILDQLENFRNSEGKFEFRLTWPGSGLQDYIWKQTSNPVTKTSRGADGYEAVSVPNNNHFWGGLEHGGSQALLDGSVNHGNWWYAVASRVAFRGGIPATNNKAVQQVELWVMA